MIRTRLDEMVIIPWAEMEAHTPSCTEGVDRGDMEKRAGTIAHALAHGATVAELARIAAAFRASRDQTLRVPTRYGMLARGRCWARTGSGQSVTWAEKDGGDVLLTEGRWVVGSDDGFGRKESTSWTVTRLAGVLVGE